MYVIPCVHVHVCRKDFRSKIKSYVEQAGPVNITVSEFGNFKMHGVNM